MRQSESGSVLIIVVVAVLFASLLFSIGLGTLRTQDNQDKILLTAKKQKFLVSELAAYAQRENRVPCPADPSVNPLTAAFGFSRAAFAGNPNDGGACTAAQAEGIVPFRTLGLEPYDAVDGWGRPMTYRVSPVSANVPTAAQMAAANIFMRCRRFPWFDDGVRVYTAPPPNYFSVTNVYPAKAVFCCPPSNFFASATDMIVSASSVPVAPINGITTRWSAALSVPPDYDNINTMTQDPNLVTQDGYRTIPPGDGTQEVFAFAIISHGADGFGTFIPGTAMRLPGATSADEKANATFATPLLTIDHPMVLSGPKYFDDMVVWRTQIGLMGELGSASCYAPWR
jgi:hypothetical protein